MRSKKLRNRLVGGATLVTATMAAMLTLSTGVAFAGVSVPAYPNVGVYPNWLTAGTGTPGTQTASREKQIVLFMWPDSALLPAGSSTDRAPPPEPERDVRASIGG